MFPDPMEAARAALQGRSPQPAAVARWLRPQDDDELDRVMAAGAWLAAQTHGNRVELCAIANVRSGRCGEDCAFCAQSAHHSTTAQVYGLLPAKEMVDRARLAAAHGAHRFGLVTSGRACPTGRDLDQICRAVDDLRRGGEIAPCLSLGLLTPDQARRLADAGAVRYHHNLEAGPSHFPAICTTHTYEDRLETVANARGAGLEVCVGGIIGLGETPDQRAELALEVGRLAPQSVPLNFLSPIPGTRLGHLPPVGPAEALAAIAVFKICAPRAVVRTCGGRQQALAGRDGSIFAAGAGGTMTGNYLTTSGPPPGKDLETIAALGLRLAGPVCGPVAGAAARAGRG